MPFIARLLLTASLALTVAGIAMLITVAQEETEQAKAKLDRVMAEQLLILPTTLADWIVVGDFAVLKESLNKFVRQQEVAAISFKSPRGAAVTSEDQPVEPRAPEWFAAGFGALHPKDHTGVKIGGRDYGTLEIVLTAQPMINQAWARLQRHMAILALAIMLDFFGIWLVLRSGLAPLRELHRGARALQEGKLSQRIIPAGSPEIHQVMTAFNDMASSLEKDRSQLLAQENYLRTTLASVEDGVITTDTKGFIDFMNPKAESLLGWTQAQARGQPLAAVLILLDETDRRELDCLAGKVLRAGEDARLTMTALLVSREGAERPVEHSASPIQAAEDTEVLGAVFVLRDRTEQRRAWMELVQANERAEAANVAKSRFLANMSHEIRTPMNGVIGMTTLLLDTPLDEEQREFSEIIRSSGESLLVVINDILDLSKIEAGKLHLDVIDFDLSSVVMQVCNALEINAKEKKIRFQYEIASGMPTRLRGDPARLRQILTNLVGNAIKFTARGGVVVAAHPVAATDENITVRFEVKDTGIGIPESRIGDLFAPFTQVDASTTRRYGGTGLGLSISKQLVGLMGGDIGVSSGEGNGSTFWFCVPLVRQARDEADTALPDSDLTGCRVILADDIDINRRLLKAMLDSWGCDTDEAPDGHVALAMLRHAAHAGRPYEIAIVDMNMPEMDGETLGRIIDTDPLIAKTRRIMVTSDAMRGDADRFRQAGFDAYLTKPVRDDHLHRCLAALRAKVDLSGQRGLITRHSIHESSPSATRILLVEDNMTNQRVALHMLAKLGYRADAVGNGLEAIKALETVAYRLVLMDCQMPEMDGHEATRQIRNGDRRVLDPAVTIIALTANAMQGDREAALAAGMNDYLPKPIDAGALKDMLANWLKK